MGLVALNPGLGLRPACGQLFEPPYFKLLESADGGASWLDRSAALPDGRTNKITALAIEPTSPGTLYLAGKSGLQPEPRQRASSLVDIAIYLFVLSGLTASVNKMIENWRR